MNSLRDSACVSEDDAVLLEKLCSEPWQEISYQSAGNTDLTTKRYDFIATYAICIHAAEEYLVFPRDYALCGAFDVGIISIAESDRRQTHPIWTPIWPPDLNTREQSELASFGSPPRKIEILRFIHEVEDVETGEKYLVAADEGIVIHSSTGQRICIIASERDVTALTFSFSSKAIDRILKEEGARARELVLR